MYLCTWCLLAEQVARRLRGYLELFLSSSVSHNQPGPSGSLLVLRFLHRDVQLRIEILGGDLAAVYSHMPVQERE